jgi:hypothetical protein
LVVSVGVVGAAAGVVSVEGGAAGAAAVGAAATLLASCAATDAPSGAARSRAKAVLARMRSYRGPLIGYSPKFRRDRR